LGTSDRQDVQGTRDDATPRARIETTAGSASRLFISGKFPIGWAGMLALGLSREQISIVRGCACRVNPGGWSAYFDLQGLKGAPSLDAVDYCALAMRGGIHTVPIAIQLEGYHLIPMLGGGIQLAVRGLDRVGFLASLLGRLAGLSLFPEEMQIETRGHVAEDRFQLRAADGRAVSAETRRAIETLLALWRLPPAARRG